MSMEECVLRVDESMLEQVHCILYDNDEAPRIYWKDFILQNEIDSSDDSEWYPKSEQVAGLVISEEVKEVKDPEIAAQTQAPPEELPAFQAVHWPEAHLGVDLRPHVWDATLKAWLLIDSGSQCTAWPPDPGDIPEEGKFLRAVNGSKIRTYGNKEVFVRIGRKSYKFEAIKADVETPVLGWDFVRRHRLDLVWNDFGDQLVVDRKAQTETLLKFKSMPYHKSSSHRKLAKVDAPPESSGHETMRLLAELAAIEALGVDEETIQSLPDSPYKAIVDKYPDLLKLRFDEEYTKNGVVHRIEINPDAKPVKAKPRRLLPGSPKAIKAKEAWDELVRLGSVEKVDPSAANTESLTFCMEV